MSEMDTAYTEIQVAQLHREIDKIWQKHGSVSANIKVPTRQRTLTQNKAMHLFFGWLAETLNDAGYDMRRTLRQDIDIPWSSATVKEHLWRPIQEALTDKHSTTEITTVEPTEIHAVLSRHLGERLGVQCPEWPKRRDAA